MITHLTTTSGADEFFPTPDGLAYKMLVDVDWSQVQTILEPSAGKGNLAEAALRKSYIYRHERYNRNATEIDCIEIDPNLRQILKYHFGEEKKDAAYKKKNALKERESSLTKAQRNELNSLRNEIDMLNSVELRVIHDDFLTYNGAKHYDLIVMNPPFSNGDKHLIHALELQKNGGEIVCLLNAETIRNPYTNSRQVLMGLLNKYGATIQYVKDGFTGAAGAERITGVEVAIVKISIPREQKKESEFWERMKKAHERESKPETESTEVAPSEFLDNIIAMYNVEVAASIKLIDEYNALKPYISCDFEREHSSISPRAILTLTVGTNSNCLQECDVNKYLKEVRLKYWGGLFENRQFTGKLTSNLQQKYREMVDKMADYDFTKFNIDAVVAEMNSEMVQGVKETILALFDRLSEQHSYLPEGSKNIHYYNGWKTNKAHKVNNKVIIPTHGLFADYSWAETAFRANEAYRVLSDIEKVFNYLDGGMTADVDLRNVLEAAASGRQTRNISCKYFWVSLFKKGTTHITFKDQKLVDKLNIYAARNKAWLPPCYGKAHYAEMDADEQAVVDEFQGAAAYMEVMANTGFYLFDAANAVMQIEHQPTAEEDDVAAE